MPLRVTHVGAPSVGVLPVPASSGLTGTLTSGTLPIASGAHTLIDSLNTVSAGVMTVGYDLQVGAAKFTVALATGNTVVAGTLLASTTLDVTGNFAVNTNKFTVAASTGNTLVAGTLNVTGNLTIGSSLFTVTAASGNTDIQGTLHVGLLVTIDTGIRITGGASDNAGRIFYDSAITGLEMRGRTGGTADLTLSNNTGSAVLEILAGTTAVNLRGNLTVNTNKFTVNATSGDGLFAGNLTVTGMAGVGTRGVVVDASGVLSPGSAGVSGSGAAGRVAYWSSGTALTSTADFLFTDSTGGGTDTALTLVNTNSGATNGALLRLQTLTTGLPKLVFQNASVKRMITSENNYLKFYLGETITDELMMSIKSLQMGFGHNVLPTAGYDFHFSYQTSQGSAFGIDGPLVLALTNPGTSSASAAAQVIVKNQQFAGIFFSGNGSWQIGTTYHDNSLYIFNDASYLTQNNILVKFWDTGQSFRTDFLLGDLSVTRSLSGGTVTSGVTNTNNASGTANARFSVTAGGSSGGDALLSFIISGVTTWSMGADNSASDALVISENAALGTSNRLTIAVGGAVTVPGTLDVTGNFAVNTNKFTVAASTGNTVIAGTLTSAGASVLGTVGANGPVFALAGHQTGYAAAPSADTTNFYVIDDGDSISFVCHYNKSGTNYYGQVGMSTNQSGVLTQASAAKATNYTATSYDGLITVDCTLGDVTITLPASTDLDGHLITVKKVAGAFNVIVVRTGGEVIDNATSVTFGTLYQAMTFQAVGSAAAWWIL